MPIYSTFIILPVLYKNIPMVIFKIILLQETVPEYHVSNYNMV